MNKSSDRIKGWEKRVVVRGMQLGEIEKRKIQETRESE